MTVKDLREQLALCDDDLTVILSRDAEGNGYSPLSEMGEGFYKAHTSWCGEFTNHPIDNPPPPNALCLWPTN